MNITFGGFTTGIIMIAIGTFLIYDAYRLNHHVLFLAWFEKQWGPGGGTLAYKAIGMVLIIFAFFIMTGLFDPFKNPLDTLKAGSGSADNSNIQNFTGGSSVQVSN